MGFTTPGTGFGSLTYVFIYSLAPLYLQLIDTPKQIKKYMDDLLALEASVDDIISSFSSTSNRRRAGVELDAIHVRYRDLAQAVGKCFEQLHLQDEEQYTMLKGLAPALSQNILCAQDLKVSIRACAVGIFFE